MKKTKACCIDCRDNFYNNNNLDIKECWNFKSAKFVLKKRSTYRSKTSLDAKG